MDFYILMISAYDVVFVICVYVWAVTFPKKTENVH